MYIRHTINGNILFMSITGYIVLFIIGIMIHRIVLKKQKKIQKNIVLAYDTIRYEIAKKQYNNTAIQEMKGIKIIMEKDNKNYMDYITDIQKEITKTEEKSGTQIITPELWNLIEKEIKNKDKISPFIQIIGWTITICTLGMYRIFRK